MSEALINPTCLLRAPLDFYPKKFELDKYETLKYNKRAIIEFLNEDDVRNVYNQIPK